MTSLPTDTNNPPLFKDRFRGYYPVVIDIETAGFNPTTDAILEIAAITLDIKPNGNFQIADKLNFNIEPFAHANLEEASLLFTGIDVHDPNRYAVSERYALNEIFKLIRKGQKRANCTRSIIVAHNAGFDLSFLNAMVTRTTIKRNPFHPFSIFDTATLAGFMLGQTVLLKACQQAGIEFEQEKAHSALYDCERTAELFCLLLNHLNKIGGYPYTTDL